MTPRTYGLTVPNQRARFGVAEGRDEAGQKKHTMADHPNQDLDAVIACYKQDVDRSLLRENLKLTPEARILKLMSHQLMAEELREAGRRAREGR